MPRGDQHSRQWRLLQLLGRPAGVAVEDASQRLGCTVRTVWRDLGVLDFRGLIDAAGAVRLTRAETRRTRWARYSARQDRRMEWEGLVGAAVYEGDLAPFWPYLVFGQWTTFGLGRYVIEPVAAGDRAAEARG
jgi:hypothetical protein